MTAIATIGALIPLAIGAEGSGREIRDGGREGGLDPGGERMLSGVLLGRCDDFKLEGW